MYQKFSSKFVLLDTPIATAALFLSFFFFMILVIDSSGGLDLLFSTLEVISGFADVWC
jgi:hypothetical protein